MSWPATALCVALIVVTACSGRSTPHPSSQAPTAKDAEATKSAHPCTLVTKSEAQAIIGQPIEAPQEAAQGPTCIYKTPDSATFITVAVLDQRFGQIKNLISNLSPVPGLGHEAYCGSYGRPTLYVVLSTDSLLTITAPCPAAEKFAMKALTRL